MPNELPTPNTLSYAELEVLNHWTINPYRIAVGLVVRRLGWDIKPEAWRSRSKLSALRDQYEGKDAVIVCNGPSLLKTDLSLLQGTYTFGLNKINLLFDKTPYRPDSIVAQQEFVIQQNKEFFNTTEIPLFIESIGTRNIKPRDNVTFFHASSAKMFARNCSISLYAGHTVTFAAMQLAFHMGFRRVALVGCDHNFNAVGQSNSVATAEGTDTNHFDPNYFSGGNKWRLPDLFESEVSYEMARSQFAAFGRSIVNCTIGGKLEIFPRMALEDFIAGKAKV